jgi:hypothetical protein
MSRLARWIAPAALAGGLVAGLVAIPAAQASSAASIISINATSPNYPHVGASGKVDGYALVIYKGGKAAAALITGAVTTSATNDTATLLAEPFHQKKYTTVGSQALTPVSGSASYSFKVKPSLATRYKVEVSGTDSATSSTVTVYVTAGGKTPTKYVHVKCTSATRCVLSVREYTLLPASAYKTEARKHPVLYLAIGDPNPPKNYTLDKSATASKAKQVNKGEFYKTLTWVIHVRNASTTPYPNACTKDTESKDGMGLPGHHGCGNKKVPTSAIYLG